MAGDGFVTQLFACVGGVLNQLADEDLLVGIDRMDDQVEELGNIGLERPAFVTGLINDGHGRRILLEHRMMARAGAGSTRQAYSKALCSFPRTVPKAQPRRALSVQRSGLAAAIFKSEQK